MNISYVCIIMLLLRIYDSILKISVFDLVERSLKVKFFSRLMTNLWQDLLSLISII